MWTHELLSNILVPAYEKTKMNFRTLFLGWDDFLAQEQYAEEWTATQDTL